MTRVRWLVLVLTSLCLAACGVGPQDRPTPIDVPAPTGATATVPRAGTRAVVVYFVREARMMPVVRSAPDASASTALALLLAGPTAPEAGTGLRTVVPPQSLVSAAHDATPRTVVIDARREFTSISGATQLLAVAQVVWTVTARPGVDRVRITVEGEPVELPTDQGLIGRPVMRSDFASVAP